MKTAALILSLLTATALSTSLFGGSQDTLVDDPALSVPGKNPLNVRCTVNCVRVFR